MKTTAILKAIALLFFSLIFMVASSQQESNKRTSEQQDFVINMKMIEKFKSSYDMVEVISWQEVLMNNNFIEAKSYLNAYINIDLNNVAPENLKQAINNKVDANKKSILEGLDRSYQIAAREDW